MRLVENFIIILVFHTCHKLVFDTGVEEDQLRRHFTQCGAVDDVRVIRDRKTGVGKGFAYIKFEVGFLL